MDGADRSKAYPAAQKGQKLVWQQLQRQPLPGLPARLHLLRQPQRLLWGGGFCAGAGEKGRAFPSAAGAGGLPGERCGGHRLDVRPVQPAGAALRLHPRAARAARPVPLRRCHRHQRDAGGAGHRPAAADFHPLAGHRQGYHHHPARYAVRPGGAARAALLPAACRAGSVVQGRHLCGSAADAGAALSGGRSAGHPSAGAAVRQGGGEVYLPLLWGHPAGPAAGIFSAAGA